VGAAGKKVSQSAAKESLCVGARENWIIAFQFFLLFGSLDSVVFVFSSAYDPKGTLVWSTNDIGTVVFRARGFQNADAIPPDNDGKSGTFSSTDIRSLSPRTPLKAFGKVTA